MKRDYYDEAVAIIKGQSLLLPEKEHLIALYDRLELAGKTDEQKRFARMEESYWDSRSGA